MSAKSVNYYNMKVIKKNRREESFNRKKVYQSVYESCLNAHHDKKISSNISEKVVRDLVRHLKGKKIVKSNEIFKYISTLLEKYDEKCSLCGWRQKHPVTGTVPLEVDHLNGDSDNNSEENLRLLCPNCHSLSPNFRNLNKGKGRAWRIAKYHKNQIFDKI